MIEIGRFFHVGVFFLVFFFFFFFFDLAKFTFCEILIELVSERGLCKFSELSNAETLLTLPEKWFIVDIMYKKYCSNNYSDTFLVLRRQECWNNAESLLSHQEKYFIASNLYITFVAFWVRLSSALRNHSSEKDFQACSLFYVK